MGNLIKLFLLFILATLVHWAVATVFSAVGISVNVMLSFAIAFCTVLKPSFGYPVVFLCGLFLDFFNTKLFGGNACTFTICACLLYTLADRLDFKEVATQAVTVFVLVAAASCLNSLLIWLFASAVLWAGIFGVLVGALLSACMAPVIFWTVQKTLTGGAMCKSR
jgi:rod shape-determining protein MreD